MMRTRSRVARGAGLTLIEILLVVFVVAALAGLFLPVLIRRRDEAHVIQCRNNLNWIGKGMAMYVPEHGGPHCYPNPMGRTSRPDGFNGAEWLASLYWTGPIPDPGVFICPSSGDTNRDGFDIGSYEIAPTFGSQTISYAGMHYESDTSSPGFIHMAYPGDRPMASDDTQGDINHGTLTNGSMSILFFDSHVEFRSGIELHLQSSVGDTAPDALLRELRN